MLTTKQKFADALREWVEVFMRRSMRETVQFWKDAGLSMPQISAMMRLHHHGACGVSEVGAHLGVTNAAASQMVDRLVQLGYLERAEDPNDRRAKQLTLTAKGRALVQKSIEARRRWLDELGAVLTAEQQTEIADALGSLTAAARDLDKAKP
ncbi:MAG: MarR family transcriptional regulator [Chloroflexi bacterium]|nr:MarR family transcriptional regulator [Chloroflexota bacterium]